MNLKLLIVRYSALLRFTRDLYFVKNPLFLTVFLNIFLFFKILTLFVFGNVYPLDCF